MYLTTESDSPETVKEVELFLLVEDVRSIKIPIVYVTFPFLAETRRILFSLQIAIMISPDSEAMATTVYSSHGVDVYGKQHDSSHRQTHRALGMWRRAHPGLRHPMEQR